MACFRLIDARTLTNPDENFNRRCSGGYIRRMVMARAKRRMFSVAAAGLGAVVACGLLALAANGSTTSPPKILITTPKNGAVVTQPTVKVAGSFTVAPFNGPSPHVSATVNGRPMSISVNGPVSYDFAGKAALVKGPNKLTVVVNDGDGGIAEATSTVKYTPVLPTRHQCVTDKRGDARDKIGHMDIVRACAIRKGSSVVFKVTTAKPPPNIHDSFGNPAAPCIEVLRGSPRSPGPAPIQSCGDAQLRGWKINTWPKVPFAISGRTSTWKVALKYLPKRSFKWRGYLSNADHYVDTAPNKGFLIFVVR